MANYASIEGGVVTNVAGFDPLDMPEWASDWVPCLDAGPGWAFDGTVFTPPAIAPQVPTAEDVNVERERRVHQGASFQVADYASDIAVAGDATTSRNLQGLAFAAQLKMAQGDLVSITPYRAEDNVTHSLTPPQIIELWSKGAAYVSAVYQAAWALKDQDTIPTDYKEDLNWP